MAAGLLIGRDSLWKEICYGKEQDKFLNKSRDLPCFSSHKNHLPKDFSHSKVSVFDTQEGTPGDMTKECISSAWRCVSILALAYTSVVEMSSWLRQSFM